MRLEDALRKRIEAGCSNLLTRSRNTHSQRYDIIRYVDGSQDRAIAKWTLRWDPDPASPGSGYVALRLNDAMVRPYDPVRVGPGESVPPAFVDQWVSCVAAYVREFLNESVGLLHELELDESDVAAEVANLMVGDGVHRL